MNRLVLISCCWLLKKTLVITTNLTNPESASVWALKRKLSIIRGVPFNFITQQDVMEILQVVLDELKGIYQ